MKCANKAHCKAKILNRMARMEPHLEAASDRLDQFCSLYEANEAVLTFDDHAEFRELWRAFSENQVMEAFINGDVIECHKHGSELGFLIWYNVKIGRGLYRPMHVRAIMNSTNSRFMTIMTVYDPRSHEWKWEDNYTRRVCLCSDFKERD